jgi:exodeoxyribonuclease VII small subunit
MTENPQNFTQKLQELEAITEWFESDKVDLNEALAKFERGMELAGDLKKELQTVENKVEKIKQKFDTPAVPTAPAEELPQESSSDEEPSLFA